MKCIKSTQKRKLQTNEMELAYVYPRIKILFLFFALSRVWYQITYNELGAALEIINLEIKQSKK